MDWRRRVWGVELKSCKWIPQRPCFRLFSMLKWGSWCNILKPIRPTTFASNMLYHPQHIGRILISAAQMHRQGDSGFSFDTGGSLWSHQSMCSARIQPRRARPRGFHADVVFFFSFLFFLTPFTFFFQRSALISLQTQSNTGEWIFRQGQIWDIWYWDIDAGQWLVPSQQEGCGFDPDPGHFPPVSAWVLWFPPTVQRHSH